MIIANQDKLLAAQPVELKENTEFWLKWLREQRAKALGIS